MFLLGIMLFVLSEIFAFNTGGPICSAEKMAHFFVPSARFFSMPSYFSESCQGGEICSLHASVDIPQHDYRLFFSILPSYNKIKYTYFCNVLNGPKNCPVRKTYSQWSILLSKSNSYNCFFSLVKYSGRGSFGKQGIV